MVALLSVHYLEPSKGPAAQSGGNNDRAVPQRALVGEGGMNY